MSDFSDRPFVAGSLTGVRSFKVDALGRLTGVRYPLVWRPGENVGTCKRADGSFLPTFTSGQVIWTIPSAFASSSTVTTRKPSPEPAKADEPEAAEPPHQVGRLGCSCGYYAYYDEGHNPHHGEGQVLALVEGYGVTTTGSRGFRSEKAKLLAFIDDSAARGGRRLTFAGWFWLVVLVVNLFGLVSYSIDGNGPLIVSSAVGTAVSISGLAGMFSPIMVRAKRASSTVPPEVRTNYPDVPIYPSLAAALAVHPLSTPAPATPETDPHFWTRSTS